MKKTNYYATTTYDAGTLTAGKKYDVFVSDEGSEDSLNSFYIKSDADNTLTCLKKGCAHIQFGDWDLVEKEIYPMFTSIEVDTLLSAIRCQFEELFSSYDSVSVQKNYDQLKKLNDLNTKLTKLNK